MTLTTPIGAGTKVAGVQNAAGEEVQSFRLVTGATGDTPVATGAPLPVGGTGVDAIKAATEAAQPARQAFAIAKHDTNAITPLPRAVRVDSAGTVVFRLVDSAADVTITAVAGEIIPGRVQYIRAAGTVPTGFVGYA